MAGQEREAKKSAKNFGVPKEETEEFAEKQCIL